MNYIIMPYFYDYTDSHYLPIEWIILDNKTKFFSYHDRLFTIQITYTKNNCKVLIHNTENFLIYSHTTTTIRDALAYITSILDTVVNSYILHNKYAPGDLHDVHLYTLFNISVWGYPSPDYDLPCF